MAPPFLWDFLLTPFVGQLWSLAQSSWNSMSILSQVLYLPQEIHVWRTALVPLGGFESQQGWLLGKTFSSPLPIPCLSLLYPRVMSRVDGLCWGQSEGEQGVTVVWASSLLAPLS